MHNNNLLGREWTLFVCLTIESLWDVDRDVSTAILLVFIRRWGRLSTCSYLCTLLRCDWCISILIIPIAGDWFDVMWWSDSMWLVYFDPYYSDCLIISITGAGHIGPAPGIEPTTSRSAVKRSIDWAKNAAVIVIFVSHAFRSTDQEKRETARSLHSDRKRPMKIRFSRRCCDFHVLSWMIYGSLHSKPFRASSSRKLEQERSRSNFRALTRSEKFATQAIPREKEDSRCRM